MLVPLVNSPVPSRGSTHTTTCTRQREMFRVDRQTIVEFVSGKKCQFKSLGCSIPQKKLRLCWPTAVKFANIFTSFSSTEVRSEGQVSLRTSGESSLTTASRSAAVGGMDCGQREWGMGMRPEYLVQSHSDTPAVASVSCNCLFARNLTCKDVAVTSEWKMPKWCPT